MGIYLTAHTKGGVAKTTTALNLAVVHAHRTGRSIALVDADRGLSLKEWNKQRKKLGILPAFECYEVFGLKAHRDVEKLAKHYDDVIIDAGGEGQGAPEISLILDVADKVLTPCRTPKENTSRLENIHQLIADARKDNDKLDAMLFPVVASTNARARDVIKFYQNVVEFPQYRVLDAVLRDRVAYENWLETGLGVIEAKMPDQLAVAELNQLYAEVFNGT